MPSSPQGEETYARGGPDMVTFPEMPDRLEQAKLTRLTVQRIRQLAETDPDWPIPLDKAPKVGRMRLFDWRVLEPYFRNRKSRQGQRTDRMRRQGEGSGSA
ncbi:hypothetical protein [Streptomyces mobaraensis]|uniref:Uncharacterized protein n=1 Tax=Streptomyces mobaraensis TaxID=35621 RepID=A0A5N5WD00_STRMB|nr:hypothetical protein [Streptomyces mobaraensis]KAB7850152.1 hypothetical protein FRZ00_06015 [Streptomyces mobaraensis]